MTLLWLAALALPFLAGYLTAALLSGRGGFFNAVLGLGMGLGLLTLSDYPFLAANGLSGNGFIWTELVVVALLSCLYLFRHRPAGVSPLPSPWLPQDYWSAALFALTVIMAGYVFLRVSVAYPHGTWDAWNNWNMIPRFILRGAEHWRDRHVYAHGLTAHPYDYPLLLALSVARIWRWLSMEATAGPALIAASFTLAAVGFLYAALAELTDRCQGFLAAALLVGTPYYINIATTQYADIPLSFFNLAAVALICLAQKDRANYRGLLVLAGLAAGLAAWTKNEGLVFISALGLARLTVSLFKGNKGILGEVLYFSLGLLVPALVLIHFKQTIAEPSHFNDPLFIILARVFNMARQIDSLSYMFSAMGPLLVLVVYLALLGVRPGALKQTGVLTGLLTCAMVVLGYHMMFVCMTPDLWNFKASLSINWERIILHIWPVFIFSFFQIAASPKLSEQGVGSREWEYESKAC